MSDTLTRWLSSQRQRDAAQNQRLLHGEASSLLTFPCLRRPRSRTLTLPHWTAPSPPPVKEGSPEGRGEAWGRVVQDAGGQTKGTQEQGLAYGPLRVLLTGLVSFGLANLASRLCFK